MSKVDKLSLSQQTIVKFIRQVETLSEREFSILRLALLGCSTREIAAALGIGNRTVDSHRVRILQKLDVDTMHAAMSHIISAYCLDIISESPRLQNFFRGHAERLRAG